MNEYVERLSRYLENDEIGWEQTDLENKTYRVYVKNHPPDLALFDLDMDRELFLFHLTVYGFSSELEFDVHLKKICD